MGWKIKVEMARWQKKENWGGAAVVVVVGKRGPVVVDTSATGAAEMEGDA